jgi:hypothetical protein
MVTTSLSICIFFINPFFFLIRSANNSKFAVFAHKGKITMKNLIYLHINFLPVMAKGVYIMDLLRAKRKDTRKTGNCIPLFFCSRFRENSAT